LELSSSVLEEFSSLLSLCQERDPKRKQEKGKDQTLGFDGNTLDETFDEGDEFTLWNSLCFEAALTSDFHHFDSHQFI